MAERWDDNWQEWRCADCDPDNGNSEYDKPYVMLVPVGEPAPSYCPRCDSYLGLCEGDDKLRITNTPAEQWARSHLKDA